MNNSEPLLEKLKRVVTGANFVTATTVGIVTIATASALYFGQASTNQLTASVSDAPVTISAFPIVKPTIRWGFAVDTFQVLERKLERGQSLSDLLLNQNIAPDQRQKLIELAAQVLDLRNVRPDKPFYVLTKDSTGAAEYLIYEPSIYEYILFDLQGELAVERIKRPTSVETASASAVVESSLWQTMVSNGYSYELTDKMEDALKWSIDFHHIKQGDEFRLVYEQNYVEGQPAGVGQVLAARYKTGDKEHTAIYYENGQHKGYFNPDGQPLKSGFLKAPVKYSRISSHFSLKRFHPVLKYNRPHYGTDYAAPYGTPIIAVGDGTVTAAARGGGNGNFVKIRHDNVYETQYLHMQRFAAGIRPGVRVEQGQVIGYVGSTGLATGPHVCFRFWKNGKQVNHLALDLPPAKPLPESEMPAFRQVRDRYLPLLNQAQGAAVPNASTDNP